MFKFAVLMFALIACASAKPWIGAHLAYSAPAAILAAPGPVVTATSSQVIARNHNGIATTPVIAPVAAPVIAHSLSAAPLAYSSPLAYTSPLAYAAGPAPVLW